MDNLSVNFHLRTIRVYDCTRQRLGDKHKSSHIPAQLLPFVGETHRPQAGLLRGPFCNCVLSEYILNRDDLILYTITADSTPRILLPVLDSPHHLQLHATLDVFSSLPFSVATTLDLSRSRVFWLDRQVLGDVLSNICQDQSEQEDGRRKRLREIKDEDLFLRVLEDGSIVISAVAVCASFSFQIRCSSFPAL